MLSAFATSVSALPPSSTGQAALSPFGAALDTASPSSSPFGGSGAASSFASWMTDAVGMAPTSSAAVAPAGSAMDPFVSALAPSGASAPFSDLLVQSVQQVNQLERAARSSIEGLISGKGVDVHQAMIATEKAEMGFDMAVAVRDKALSAYQQVMGMQF